MSVSPAGSERWALPVGRARGQETLERLLAAAEELLRAGGLEAATVPAIAERAGVSVGNVYKRFPDKDALMRAVYERFFANAAEQNRAALTLERWERCGAREIVSTLVASLVTGYRVQRRLLRALLDYAESHPDAAFRRHAEKLNGEAMARIGELLLTRRAELDHPDPEGAVPFALLALGFALRGFLLRADKPPHPYTADDARFAEELTRMMLRYLGVRAPKARARPPRRSRA